MLSRAKENHVNLVLGTDSVIADDFKNDLANQKVCPSNDIQMAGKGMDAGPETRKAFAAAIKGSKTILWNGPAGVFEFDNFSGGSRAVLRPLLEATKEGAFSHWWWRLRCLRQQVWLSRPSFLSYRRWCLA